LREWISHSNIASKAKLRSQMRWVNFEQNISMIVSLSRIYRGDVTLEINSNISHHAW